MRMIYMIYMYHVKYNDMHDKLLLLTMCYQRITSVKKILDTT